MKIIEPIILKGTREFGPQEMAKRNLVTDKIRKIFERFGYDQIETPILNPAETILGKYGEEGDRLAYSFEDNGKRRLALPYDLTVPFARYFAANFGSLPLPFKRYQIQRVWRAEKPQKGRLREFYQCDIDVIATESLIAEAEVALVVTRFFEELGFENFKLKLNSRRLMNNVLEAFSVPKERALAVIRVIDKMAKISEAALLKELEDLGVKEAKKLLEVLRPEKSILETLKKLRKYDTSEIETVLGYINELGVEPKYIDFDPSLARGLDYYTGLVYEVVSLDGDNLGSLCGGGRYDDLCGLFCKESFSGVGVAFGFERIMMAMEERGEFTNIGLSTQVLVTLFDETSISDSLKIYSLLTSNELKCEIYFEPEKLKKQFKYADKKQIPFVVVQGPEEKELDQVTVKSMQSGKQKTLPMSQLINFLTNYENTK